jgi:hypothetical protein
MSTEQLQEGPGAYTKHQLARRCAVSVKFIEKHRRRLPGAMRVGGIWRWDRAAVERRILGGKVLLD